MNADVKKDWTCALRSGEYTQGHHGLKLYDTHGNAKHCCLGVLVDVYIKEKGDEAKIEWEEADERDLFVGVIPESGGLPDRDYLPEEVAQWAGLKSTNPTVDVGDQTTSLSLLNDGAAGSEFGDKWSFDEIADAIEQSL